MTVDIELVSKKVCNHLASNAELFVLCKDLNLLLISVSAPTPSIFESRRAGKILIEMCDRRGNLIRRFHQLSVDDWRYDSMSGTDYGVIRVEFDGFSEELKNLIKLSAI